jgi:hypothetical protein
MTPAACKRALAPLGLDVAFERDATTGWEALAQDKSGGTVACVYHEGSKSDAADELMAHPAIKMRLSRAGGAS